MTPPTTEVAFTPSVKAEQERRGSRRAYAKLEAKGGWSDTVTAELAAMIAQVRSFYLATANTDGQPYIQHRGGPPGFLRVLDPHTLGFADFSGNRQYITAGNLADNPRAFIFLMDYTRRRRVKLWGRARMVTDDPELVARLMPDGYKARPEQAILFTLAAWDVNCQQHIPHLLPAEDVAAAIEALKERVRELETQITLQTGRSKLD
ncbi:MAG: pyridoxamine 5'-phosphate oxidase family protein [Hyphomicrobiaceae bacterium]